MIYHELMARLNAAPAVSHEPVSGLPFPDALALETRPNLTLCGRQTATEFQVEVRTVSSCPTESP
ncbi:hypothetical protein [Aliiruegeria lutimaris]|uniref:Uncharacterized protein n=1 Tax=Aliiruegeria lutimaris TaxID=571298 RepID=A0A1G8LR85_9RHOB|nr:hypothetical protein SAMN04488026_1004122 [Aliiruegeria lutimaris]